MQPPIRVATEERPNEMDGQTAISSEHLGQNTTLGS